MNARWTWCLGQVWCHSPKLESQKKELVMRKGGERCLLGDILMISPWDHHEFVWECSRLTTIPNMSLVKTPARLGGGWEGGGWRLHVTNFMSHRFNTKLKLPLVAPNSCTSNDFDH